MLRTHRIHPALWLGLALALLAIAAAAVLAGRAGARVVALSPADGDGDVPITAPIRVTFSRDMDTASVVARFRIEPEAAGELEWEGHTLTFRPRGALAPDTAYVVTVEPGVAQGILVDSGQLTRIIPTNR
jgi:hypothetical protein